MADSKTHQITALLIDCNNGDETAFEQLVPVVYDELRRMARSYLRRQAMGHTLQTTELIHEAYVKLAGRETQNWENRAHFFGVASRAMRHILVDHARGKSRLKRGGPAEKVTLNENLTIAASRSQEIVALDEALGRLNEFDARKARVVEMKFFGGMTTEEVADVLKVSIDTVKRDWRFARNWLLGELAKESTEKIEV